MEYTDNVFTGQDLGVDKVENLYVDDETGDIMADIIGGDVDVDETGVLVPPESPSMDEMEVIEEIETIDEEEGDGGSGTSPALLLENNDHNINELMEEEEEDEQPTRLESFPKTPEEESFLDMALSDDDNFVFDGMSDQYRQHLKDSMERIVVPGNTYLYVRVMIQTICILYLRERWRYISIQRSMWMIMQLKLVSMPHWTYLCQYRTVAVILVVNSE
jgi:hypothetical protein